MNALFILLLAVLAVALLATWAKGFNRQSRLISAFNAIGDGVHEGASPVVLEVAVTARHLLLRKGTAANGALLGTATDMPWGFAQDEGAIADVIAMFPLGMGGRSVLGVASAAIVAGARVTGAASGKLRTLPGTTGTYFVVGYALTAAGADNDPIEIVSCVPYTVVIP